MKGRHIDLVAQRTETFQLAPEKWIVEITTERVDVTKGSKDAQKLLLAQKSNPGARLLLISTAGFTDDQRATLRDLGIFPLTYTEFESSKLNLSQYAAAPPSRT